MLDAGGEIADLAVTGHYYLEDFEVISGIH